MIRKLLAIALSILAALSLLTPALAAQTVSDPAAKSLPAAVNEPSAQAVSAMGQTPAVETILPTSEAPLAVARSSPLTDEENFALNDEMDLGNKEKGEPYDEAGLLTYRSENGEVTIMSCDEAAMGELYIPASINGEPVTAIHDNAFLLCAALTAVTLPETVTTIGDSAFYCCTQLTRVTIEGEGVTLGRKAFYRCADLAEVHFTGTAALIGEYAFGYCDSLTAVDFQKGADELGDYAFAGCSGLTALPIQTSGKPVVIGSYAFYKCTGLVDVTVPANVSSLGDYVFSTCSNLERVVLDDGMTAKQGGKGLFYWCQNLTSAHLPESWTAIPDETFYYCLELTYTLPDNLTYIGAGAFERCSGLPDDLVIPAGVTEIGARAFYNCNFTSVVLPEGLKEVKDYTFYSEPLDRQPTLASVTLPEGLVSIGQYAFAANKLSSLTLPSTLEVLGDYAFGSARNCSTQGTVSEIELPAGLTYLGWEALGCCSGIELDELVLPESLTYFGGCFGRFKKIVLPASLETVADQAFSKSKSTLEEVVIQCPPSAFQNKYQFGPFIGCTALTSVTLPEDWTEIPALLFNDTGLTSITIPAGVTAIGTSAFQKCTNLESVQLPGGLTTIGEKAFYQSGVQNIVLPDSLTEIGKEAFAGSGLTSVTLPESVQTIGDNAFQSCACLTELTIGCDIDASSVFAGCGVKTVTFSSGVTAIAGNSFYGCGQLETVRLPDTIREIGKSAFARCTSLSSVNFPEGLETIRQYAFQYTALTAVSLPSTLKRLEPMAFANTAALVSVYLADGMTNDVFVNLGDTGFPDFLNLKDPLSPDDTVGDYNFSTNKASAFYGCSNLSSVRFPDNWTYIPDNFFQGCRGPLGKLVLPDGITAIGAYAFYRAEGLTELVFPAGLQSIGEYALSGCTGLTGLDLPDGLPEDGLGEYAIGGCPNLKTVSLPSSWTSIPDGLFQGNRSIETYDLPEGITRIGNYAFADSALKELKLPGTLQKIGAGAFQNCTGVTQVALPEGLKSVGSNAFSGTGVTEITIPGSVTTVGAYAFYDCDSLKTVTVQSGVSAIDNLAFGFCDNLTGVSLPTSAIYLARTIVYGSNPGQVTIQCSANSMAEELAKSLLYVGSDNTPALAGATFHFNQNYPFTADSHYYVDYQGMSFEIYNANSTTGPQCYVERGNIANYYAVLLGWDPSFTSLVVPDDIGGIPVKYFGSGSAALLEQGLITYSISKTGPSGGAVSNCSQLRSLTVGSNMETLRGALYFCTGLEELVLKEGITTIHEGTFEGLTGLTSLVLPSTLTDIGKDAFNGCTGLSSVTFREGLISIGETAFANAALTDVYLPSTLTGLDPAAFDPDVVLHFTGTASVNMYTWIDENMVVHHVYSMPELLESLGGRVAQFQGAGLDGQATYFISTETAGLNLPVSAVQFDETPREQTAETDIVADTAPVLENLDVPNEVVIDAPEEPEQPPVEEPPEEEPPEEEEEDDEEDQPVIYEVMLDLAETIRKNPLATAAVAGAVILLIALGAWHRWIVAKKEKNDVPLQ